MSSDRLIVYAQGMRRSGTTILFDLMLEDRSFLCFYEPLAHATTEALGGGSGAHGGEDLFQSVKAARQDFLQQYPEWETRWPYFAEMNLLNYGAPRLPELEFEPDLPRYCRDYISFLSNRSDKVFLKFTRAHTKVDCLAEIEPGAKFIHIVRDPRHVTCSYLFGRDGKNKRLYSSARSFFGRTSSGSAWSSRAFSEYIRRLEGYQQPDSIEDFKRVLLIWRYKFDATHAAGERCFGKNYMLFRHEDLLMDPEAALSRLNTFLGADLNAGARSWAKANLKPPSEPAFGDDPRWAEAYEHLGMADAVRRAGYVA